MPVHQYYLSPELANPLAAIDVGTNSIRLIIAEGLRQGKYRILDDEKETTRLGSQLGSTGRLDPEAVERSLVALTRMKQIADGYQVSRMRAIATCAVREAEDGEEFCRRVRDEVGLELEVIDSQQEARLAHLSVQRNFDLQHANVVVADIGGGSTEIVAASSNVIEEIYTTTLGAVRLSDQFQIGEVASEESFAALTAHIDETLRKRVGKPPFVPQFLIGTGGTFTTLASVMMESKGQTQIPLRGYEILRPQVRRLLEQLRKMPLKSRRSVNGLSPDRADIIVAGLAIIDRLLRYFRVNQLQIHSGGVRDGLLLTMVEGNGNDAAASVQDRLTAVQRFAAGCGVDVQHGDHVARLAGEIYAEMAPVFNWPEDDRQLLETAARLQDVGYLINYEDHHKHSYHLILNSDLPGFQTGELQLVANVARYHRGAPPKRKHEHFQQLSKADKLRVRVLAGILRVAGGLDRSHTQQVQGVSVLVEDARITIHALSSETPEVDLWGARRRSELLAAALEREVEIEWRPAYQSSQAG